MGVERIRLDGVLVIGAGLAGLSAALAAAPRHVLVISPATLSQACSSAWAQGGVAVAFGAEDAPALHADDTVAAGAGLVDPAMALRLAEAGPAAVNRLADLGAPFDRDAEGRFVQGLEAAHSLARIARVKGDQAGRAIMETVAAAVLAVSVAVTVPDCRGGSGGMNWGGREVREETSSLFLSVSRKLRGKRWGKLMAGRSKSNSEDKKKTFIFFHETSGRQQQINLGFI